jgi:hypothetical protein
MNKQPAIESFSKPLPTDRPYATGSEPRCTTSSLGSPHVAVGEQASDAMHSKGNPLSGGGSEQWKDGTADFRQDKDNDLDEHSRRAKPSSMEIGFTIFSVDDADVVDPHGLSQNSLMSHQASVHDIERTEIPNTPTQRSSQLDIPNSILYFRTRATEEVAEANSSSLPSDSGRPRTITALTVLCSRCQTQRVLAKKDIAEVIW